MFANSPKCPFCGATDQTIPVGGSCPGCGRQLTEKFCIVCRRERRFSGDTKMEGCWQCGAVFTNAPNDEGEAISLLIEEGMEKHAGLVLCENCGGWTDKQKVFCQNCGALRR